MTNVGKRADGDSVTGVGRWRRQLRTDKVKWGAAPRMQAACIVDRGHIDKPISAYTSCCVQTSYVKHSF